MPGTTQQHFDVAGPACRKGKGLINNTVFLDVTGTTRRKVAASPPASKVARGVANGHATTR
eukprot:14844071-Heterocapsa_arctica.AAC.1